MGAVRLQVIALPESDDSGKPSLAAVLSFVMVGLSLATPIAIVYTPRTLFS